MLEDEFFSRCWILVVQKLQKQRRKLLRTDQFRGFGPTPLHPEPHSHHPMSSPCQKELLWRSPRPWAWMWTASSLCPQTVPPWLCSRSWWRSRVRTSPWTAQGLAGPHSPPPTSVGWFWRTATPCNRPGRLGPRAAPGPRAVGLAFYSLHSKHFTQFYFWSVLYVDIEECTFVFHSKLKGVCAGAATSFKWVRVRVGLQGNSLKV